MESPDASQMLYAIGYQESRFDHRVQLGGPARGFWQFERLGGVIGVLSHSTTRDHIRNALSMLRYADSGDECYTAIAHNDALAACFARLLLYTLPAALPTLDDSDEGWRQYKQAWGPGKPHPETWSQAWAFATRMRSLPR